MEEQELADEVAARLDMDKDKVAEVVHEVLDVMGGSDPKVVGRGGGYGYGGSDPGALEQGGGYSHGGSGDEPVGGAGYGPGGS